MKNTTLISVIAILLLLYNCQDSESLNISSESERLIINDSIVDIDTIIQIDTIINIDTIRVDTIKIDTIIPDTLTTNVSKNASQIIQIAGNADYLNKSYDELMAIMENPNTLAKKS